MSQCLLIRGGCLIGGGTHDAGVEAVLRAVYGPKVCAPPFAAVVKVVGVIGIPFVCFNIGGITEQPTAEAKEVLAGFSGGAEIEEPILRGAIHVNGKNEPNYHYEQLLEAIAGYEKLGLANPFIMVDTNHDNSGKQYLEQVRIVRETLLNRDWNEKIKQCVRGFMIESYLEDGRQDHPVVFGKSITDPCLGWEKTQEMIREIYKHLANKSY